METKLKHISFNIDIKRLILITFVFFIVLAILFTSTVRSFAVAITATTVAGGVIILVLSALGITLSFTDSDFAASEIFDKFSDWCSEVGKTWTIQSVIANSFLVEGILHVKNDLANDLQAFTNWFNDTFSLSSSHVQIASGFNVSLNGQPFYIASAPFDLSMTQDEFISFRGSNSFPAVIDGISFLQENQLYDFGNLTFTLNSTGYNSSGRHFVTDILVNNTSVYHDDDSSGLGSAYFYQYLYYFSTGSNPGVYGLRRISGNYVPSDFYIPLDINNIFNASSLTAAVDIGLPDDIHVGADETLAIDISTDNIPVSIPLEGLQDFIPNVLPYVGDGTLDLTTDIDISVVDAPADVIADSRVQDGISAFEPMNLSSIKTAFTSLYENLLYDGTDAIWIFPGSGVVPFFNRTFWDEQEIDLNEWINKEEVVAIKSIGGFLIWMSAAFVVFRTVKAIINSFEGGGDDND